MICGRPDEALQFIQAGLASRVGCVSVRGAEMLTICTDDLEAEICGTASDLRGIRIAILRLISSAGSSASLPAAAIDPSPYTRVLPELIIQRSDGPTRVTTTETGLLIAGSDDSLARFSAWFDLPPETQPGDHSHFEPLPGDLYHSSESIPLVVAVSHAGI